MNPSTRRGKIFKHPIVYVIFGLLCAVLVSAFYFTQDSTKKKTFKAPERLIEPSAACTPTEIKDSKLLSAPRVFGANMDEDEAMAFLFAGYDRTDKIASWCPDKDSETIQYLYNKRSLSELETELAFSARYQENGHPHFIIIIKTEHFFDSCHACTVVLGGAIFHQKDGLWRLKALDRAIAAAGSWGRSPSSMSLSKIGPDLHAVVVRDGYMAQGEYLENLHIMGPVGDGWRSYSFFSMLPATTKVAGNELNKTQMTVINAMPMIQPQPSVEVPMPIILTLKLLKKALTTKTVTM